MCKSNQAAQGGGCGFIVNTWRGDRWGASAMFEVWADAEKERKRLTELCEWDDIHRPRIVTAGN